MICLDTNVAIALLGGEAAAVRHRYRQALTDGETFALSSIVLFELWFGVEKSARKEANQKKLAGLVSSPMQIIHFDSTDAEEAADVRAYLRREGTPIGPYDILIAAQARRRGALLITANTREFARVPRLKIEDWTIP